MEIFDADDLAQLAILTVGTRLEQGSVYVDEPTVWLGAPLGLSHERCTPCTSGEW